jgi:SAM-dependent methyltransferase
MEQHMSSEFQEGLVHFYDRFFNSRGVYLDGRVGADFANLGFFLPGTPDHTDACENLMEHLLGLIRSRKGLILDVGCGLGGSTRHLTRYYPPEHVHGINISEYQLDECRRRVPGSHFHLMSAERLAFPDGMFDAVISVEAAPHFKGRREFLEEARRVLKPSGELVVADLLFNSEPRAFRKVLKGQELYQNLDEYRALWEANGFGDVSCEDVTRPCWRGFVEHIKGRVLRDLIARAIDAATFRRLVRFVKDVEGLPVSAYVFARGVKPE